MTLWRSHTHMAMLGQTSHAQAAGSREAASPAKLAPSLGGRMRPLAPPRLGENVCVTVRRMNARTVVVMSVPGNVPKRSPAVIVSGIAGTWAPPAQRVGARVRCRLCVHRAGGSPTRAHKRMAGGCARARTRRWLGSAEQLDTNRDRARQRRSPRGRRALRRTRRLGSYFPPGGGRAPASRAPTSTRQARGGRAAGAQRCGGDERPARRAWGRLRDPPAVGGPPCPGAVGRVAVTRQQYFEDRVRTGVCQPPAPQRGVLPPTRHTYTRPQGGCARRRTPTAPHASQSQSAPHRRPPLRCGVTEGGTP